MMNRRKFLAALVAGTSSLACNRQARSGPVDIGWGHETDDRCHMVIGDRLFAAEIRDSGGKVWKFDDIGCAVFWLKQHAIDEQAPGFEIWVADFQTGDWLDARNAHYIEGIKSPMRYQFGATAKALSGAIDYSAMKQSILARGR